MYDDSFDESWLVRDFEEFDEKLPLIAEMIFELEIDYRQVMEAKTEPSSIIAEIVDVMRNTLECLTDMTADEFDYYFDTVIVACEVKNLVLEGVLSEADGKVQLKTGDA